MSRRNKIIIGVIVAIIIIAAAVLLWWWLSQRPAAVVKPPTNTNQGLQIPANLPTQGVTLPAQPSGPVKQANVEADLKAIASTFAERYGSFSNEENFSNLESLKDLMSPSMLTTVNSMIAANTAGAKVYHGITTKTLSAEILSYDNEAGKAEIEVVTQRQEAQGSTANPVVYYQNIKLQVVKTTDGWKVDSAVWESRK
jgi:hypothetical protein